MASLFPGFFNKKPHARFPCILYIRSHYSLTLTMAASPGFQEPNSCPYCRATPKQLYHMLVPWCEEIKKAAEENMRRWAPNIDDEGNYVILVCKPCEVEYQRRDDVRMRHASIISGRQMIGPTWVDRAWAQWWDDAWTDFCIRECVQISTLRDIWKAHVFFGYWV